MGLKLKLDDIKRDRVPGSAIIYLPAGPALKTASFGYATPAADLIYLWAIQYFSDTDIPDRYDHVERVFDIIFDLDPLYIDAYEIGAVIAVYEAHDVELGLRILDKGIDRNPGEWLLPFQAGHYAQQFLEDYSIARRYYGMAMDVPGAPAQTRRLFANAAFETMDYETSLKTWLEVYETAGDERTRKIASNHLYRVKSAVDVAGIGRALELYHDRYGHYPAELELLVQMGLLDRVPRDMDGKAYLYDPESGRVAPPTIPWKR